MLENKIINENSLRQASIAIGSQESKRLFPLYSVV